jgi:subtilisin family serine protease
MKYLYLLLGLALTVPVTAQTYKVKRGERPPVDLQSLPASAYHKGVIKIKLNESLTRQMDQHPATVDSKGIVKLGISSIDQLNSQFGAYSFSLPFSSPAHNSKFSERHRAWGFHLWYKLYFDESVDVKALVEAYQALGEVAIAEPEYTKMLVTTAPPVIYDPAAAEIKATTWMPDDPRLNEQWHYHNTGQQNGTPDADIDLPEAWEITKGNPEVIVCIEDGGINYTHNDLAANMWEGIGYNFVTNTPNVSSHDHGTHVAGTVAAVTNNAVGVAGVAGGNGSGDGVRLMSCQVFTNGGSGGFENAPIWAADNGAAISQNSWQYTSPNSYDQSVLDAIDYFNINGGGDALVDGGITIFAAGNNDSQSSYYPAYYSGTFSVAGLNNQDKKSWYSNYGTWVEVSAPGGETDNVTERGVLSTLPNNTYGFYQGTSMACPHVSGLAALIASLAYGQFTPQQLGDIIKNTTDDVDALNPTFAGKLGTGRINAFAALTEAQNQMINVNNPLAFTALAGSSTTVNLNWVKNNENNDVMVAFSTSDVFGDPVQSQLYQVGDVIEGGGTIVYKGAESIFIHSDLSSNTSYYYRAWSLNDVNEYSQGLSATATTLKDPVTVFPYHESFDPENFPPANWENKQLSGNALWDRQTAGTNPECQPQSGEGMARFASHDFPSGNSGILVSPPVQFGSEEYEASLWVYRDSELTDNTDKLDVYINLSPNTGFATLLGTIHRSYTLAPAETGAGWHQYTFEIPATYLNKLAYLVFKGTSNQGNNLFVDDVQVEVPVNCFPPENLRVDDYTSSEAAISWTGVEPATAWDLEYGLSGFEPGSGTSIHITENQYTELSGLEQNTSYDVYVRSACDDENQSSWAGPASFTTLCSADSPWSDGFENNETIFGCWQVMRNTADDGGLNGNNLSPAVDDSWFVCTPESFGGTGHFYIAGGERSAAVSETAPGFNWLISGELNLPATGKNDLKFMLRFNNSGQEETRFHVNLLTDGAWRTIRTFDGSSDENDLTDTIFMNLDAWNGKNVRLAFVYEQHNGSALSVDDISIMPATNYWTGEVNTSWEEAGNWRTGLPAEGSNIHIYKTNNQPTINGSMEINNPVTIHAGASMILGPEAEVTANSEFHNFSGFPEGLLLQADETSSATLIFNSGQLLSGTVEYLNRTGEGVHAWQLLSSPVLTQDFVPGFLPATQTVGNEFRRWYSGDWISSYTPGGLWNDSFGGAFVRGNGYLGSFSDQHIRYFTGAFGSGAFEMADLGNAGNGWHLLGNPYTASLIWDPGYTTLAYTAKVWDAASASYLDLYPGGIIPVMSGFWVQNPGSTTVGYLFEPEKRTHLSAYTPSAGEEIIKLTVTENLNNTSQSSVIRINPESTTAYDQFFDSQFLAGFAPVLYTELSGVKYSTNTLPAVTSGMLLSIGFEKNEATEYQMQVQLPALYPGMQVYLSDRKNGALQNIIENPTYSFTAATGDDPARFELIFGTVGMDDNPLYSNILCYASGKSIILKSVTPIEGQVVVSGLDGKQLLEKRVSGDNLITLDAGKLAAGLYLVTVAGENGRITRKVLME